MSADLELISTGGLIHELMKRHDAGYIMLASNLTESKDSWRSARRGDPIMLMGVLELHKHRLANEIERRIETLDSRFIRDSQEFEDDEEDEDDENP